MLIETAGLRKTFRNRQKKEVVEAVRGVDLAVKEGEIFGFLGPNGAGKTTTLRMLSTLLEPSGGTAVVAGFDLRKQPVKVRRAIGYVGQSGGTWGEVSAREELVMQGKLYEMPKSECKTRAQEVIEAFEMTEFADRKCKTYSGGQRRRLDVALGTVHRPKLLFLDEPTTGLDPQSRAHMWDEVRKLRERGTSIFLTTHYLDEADALCDRLAIIDHGEIVTEGTPLALKRQIAGDIVAIGVNGDATRARELLDAKEFVREVEAGEPDQATGSVTLRLFVEDGSAAVPEILRTLDAADIAPSSIELHRPSLDDVFLKQTGRSLREND
ncbi:daunorubicin resistance protein DrrA family ABC transporter ATP-binding protein [Stackebrandtia nassauensis]|uniref:Daunorubicin resistance ABC transporter ATPase subunit n=1 Tax=Stackebrandtia nassauensis (strain DSM 44728 / CIP 108903 / NRRL B-16338 / NBRC 102104 / LLR-40K-21) TaxID=446470 RepID=D3Q7Z2_STANL|nr:daunorubicin resistance protein DrrA family ABC transporter ATP-binding protein [Stackebrandtia nassauensis]ADD40497.1 daunorubicin resistance ABC transporter ATPase subunit [Stackebrandtia nassauensis DSM 44728]